jgi:hypothetical protein
VLLKRLLIFSELHSKKRIICPPKHQIVSVPYYSIIVLPEYEHVTSVRCPWQESTDHGLLLLEDIFSRAKQVDIILTHLILIEYLLKVLPCCLSD